jgi:hypothetical protein
MRLSSRVSHVSLVDMASYHTQLGSKFHEHLVHAMRFTSAKFTIAHSSHKFVAIAYLVGFVYDDDTCTLLPVFGVLYFSVCTISMLSGTS